MNTYTFLLILLSQVALIGLTVYLVFHVLFQKTVASRMPSQRDEVSELPVMSGFVVEKPELPSLTETVADILRRAWRLGGSILERGIASYLSDWYVVGFIVLLALIVVLLITGW